MAVLGGLVVFAIAHVVFPYHSINHDEGVYLQQAAMLLEGQLFLNPPVDGPFRPWFFVESEQGLYPKYTPVTAVLFAVGKLLGGFRIALALIATATLAMTYYTVREVFDPQTGVVASVLMLASPLFLVNASVFLSYVPTMLLNLVFAGAYLHADRTGSRRTAAIAGIAVGLAFFSRAYTAVLFATPFIFHALWSLRRPDRPVIERVGLTALFGAAGVGATVAYNAVVTGDPLLFPYEAFAPRDGLGFGERQLLDYEQAFTPALSVRVNAEILYVYVTQWAVAGPLGVLAAVVGGWRAWVEGLDGRKLALGAVAVTVPLGNLYFWGTMNMLGSISNPNDGLIRFLGPYYHVDLLVPTVAFGAVGVRFVARRVRERVTERVSAERVRPALAAALLVGATLGTGAAAAAIQPQLADNYTVTETYEEAYEPFGERQLENSVVFLPRTYGNWLNHPFQALRNDPGFDGDVVYSMERQQFAVADSYPDREYYRYVYRGGWAPFQGQSVNARLQPVETAAGDSVETEISGSFPDGAESVTLGLTNGSEGASANQFTSVAADEPLALTLATTANRTRLTGPHVGEPISVQTPESGYITMFAFVDFGADQAIRYRVALPVDRANGTVRVLTPGLEICRSERLCGGQAAYVPGAHREGVTLNATVRAQT